MNRTSTTYLSATEPMVQLYTQSDGPRLYEVGTSDLYKWGIPLFSSPSRGKTFSGYFIDMDTEVISFREWLQMVRVNAQRLATEMMKLMAFWYRAMTILKKYPVCFLYLCANPDSSVVSIRCLRTATFGTLPDPARCVVSTVFDLVARNVTFARRVAFRPSCRFAFHIIIRKMGLWRDWCILPAAAPAFPIRYVRSLFKPFGFVSLARLDSSPCGAVSYLPSRWFTFDDSSFIVGLPSKRSFAPATTPAMAVVNVRPINLPVFLVCLRTRFHTCSIPQMLRVIW